MDVSLFKRLSERHPQAVVSLEHQYRMNQDIMELSNTLIYENRLKCGTERVARAVLELPDWDELLSYIKENTTGKTGLCFEPPVNTVNSFYNGYYMFFPPPPSLPSFTADDAQCCN